MFSVRLHDDRYHGAGEWPPSPARLFQALVAGAGLSGPLHPKQVAALQWLETACTAPIIAAPLAVSGQSFGNFVPNNDLDAKGGDPRNLGAVRTKKPTRPRLFAAATPFLYAWEILSGDESSEHLRILGQLADCLYQFGRGVDFAWAEAECLDREALEERLGQHLGAVHRPTHGAVAGFSLACPVTGSFLSLERRYAAGGLRFAPFRSGRNFAESFQQPPKAKFALVSYDAPPRRRVFDLRPSPGSDASFPWPLHGVCQLVKLCRDGAEQRLNTAFPSQVQAIQRWLIGRRVDGTNGGSPAERIRLVPLASIGHVHADLAVRRLLVEVFAGCPLSAEDVFWAFNGLPLSGADENGPNLAASDDDKMLEAYVAGPKGAMIWRSVTPVALPETARRRRIEPSRRVEEAKPASEKGNEQMRAAQAVRAALRHAEVTTAASLIVVRRKPFHTHGESVAAFAEGSRFPKERLWHVEIRFAEPRRGLLVIGDGRFSGLGIMAPIRSES